MGNGIFNIRADGQLVESTEVTVASEDLFQQLLADYPSLIAGDQVDPDVPRRWLLVTREASVPDDLDSGGRWALDHLFLDQDGIPTLVEVKRSTDTRIRREVVGQMLDYAANAVAYWPVENVLAMFDARCVADGNTSDQVLAGFLGEGGDATNFWSRVKTNLQAGHIRMIFVADAIPPELRRIVEFLNQQMDPAEVLALEIKQYQGGEIRTLVPRVFGQTAGATRKSPVQASRTWDEQSFMAELQKRRGPRAATAAAKVLAWSRQHDLRIWWGRGAQDGSFFPMLDHAGRSCGMVSLWTYGSVEVQFQWMKRMPPFDDLSVRRELFNRLNAIPGVDLPESRIEMRPAFKIDALTEASALEAFLGIFEWFVGRARMAEG